MHTQHGIRRWVLSVLVVLVAASAALGTGHGASAVEDDGAYPIDGYTSAEDFKLMCEIMDGTYSKDKYGNTNCEYPDGSWTQCDSNGQDCWRGPARLQRPGVELTYDEPAPLYESPTAADVPPSGGYTPIGRGEFIEAAPTDAAVLEDGAGGVRTGEQAPSGPATRPHTEPLAPVVDTTTSPDTQPVQVPVQEAGAVVAVPVEEQP
jgi:hypothetical protein